MEEELSLEDMEKIKICFNEMVINRKSSVDLSLDVKEIETNLKTDVAEVKNYKKGDGTTDITQVKAPLLKEAIAIVQIAKENKLQDKADTLDEYIDDIKNNKYNKDIIETYVNKLNILTENKATLKDIKDSYGGIIDKDILKALDKITKLIEKDYLQSEKEKLDEKAGKKKKTKSKTSSVDTIALELMKKLGIDL